MIFAGGVVAFSTAAGAGPINYLTQARHIEGTVTEDYGALGTATHTEEADAPDFEPFSTSVTSVVNAPEGLATGQAIAAHTSRLEDAGITVRGTAEGFTTTENGTYGFRSSVDTTFELDEARTFSLAYTLQQAGFVTPDSASDIVLSRVDGGAVFDIDPIFDEQGSDGDTQASGARTGTLAPGTYRFLFLHGMTTDTVEDTLDYSMSFALTPADDGGPTPNPIPLPPALWSGLGAAAALAGARLGLGRRVRV